MSSMILIPSGPFVMGLSKQEIKRICRRFDLDVSLLADTMPRREIYLSDFYIDKYPVTNIEFYQYVLESGIDWTFSKANPLPQESENLPAVMVTYDMARDYANWAGKRLPTEEEWEKAARGKFAMLFAWGGVWNPDRLSGSVSGQGSPSPVNAHPMGSSPFGVMDMMGNVWEWTSTDSDGSRVIKGGSFKEDKPYQFICAYSSVQNEDEAGDNTGFRCVMDSPDA
jgi:formylglycine-generating enzyme required for sulfatase activity